MTHEIVSMHARYKSEGTDVHGYLSKPVDPGPWPGVVLIHAYMGMGSHYRDLSRRLAKEGFVVLAPDLYHGETADNHTHAANLKVSLNVRKAVKEMVDGSSYLQTFSCVSDAEGVVGFCMSGGLALLAAAQSNQLDATVAYYPSLYPDAETLEQITCPVLLHYGTADEVTPASEMENLRRALDAADVSYQYYEYEGANHAFLNDSYEQWYHDDAANRSWNRTIEFFGQQLTT